MKISGKRGGWPLLKEWTSHSLSRGLVIKLMWPTAIFFVQLCFFITGFLEPWACQIVCLLVLIPSNNSHQPVSEMQQN